jgi:hypothetical protein
MFGRVNETTQPVTDREYALPRCSSTSCRSPGGECEGGLLRLFDGAFLYAPTQATRTQESLRDDPVRSTRPRR